MKPTAVSFAIFWLFAQSIFACTLPVFRYALDRWNADAFHLQVSPEDAVKPEVAKFLRNFSAASALNLTIEHVKSGESRLLRPDAPPRDPNPFWSGSLTDQFLNSLSQGESRDEIVRRLLSGDSIVFVVVESEDGAADDKVAAALEKRLRYLQQVVEIPAADPSDASSKPGPGPELKVKFSVLRIPGLHTAPKIGTTPDSLLPQLLAGPKSGLEQTSEPWVAAVFGRGRVLGAWPAAEFGDEQIEEVALFLAGACSCQVKRQNPGWDLLLHVDWDEALLAQSPEGTPRPEAKKKAEEAQTPQPETVRIEPSPAVMVQTAKAVETRSKEGWEVGLGVAVLGLVVVWLLRRNR